LRTLLVRLSPLIANGATGGGMDGFRGSDSLANKDCGVGGSFDVVCH